MALRVILGAGVLLTLVLGCGPETDAGASAEWALTDPSLDAFTCGTTRCSPYREYCVRTRKSVRSFGELGLEFSCAPLPNECVAKPRCGCMVETTCSDQRGRITVDRVE